MNTIIDKLRAYNIINLSMRKRTLLGQEYQKSQLNGKIGDILLYNTSKDDMLFVHADDYTLTSYPRNSYTPIGICCASADYTLDGFDRVCSLVNMSASSPTTGTTNDDNDKLSFGPSGITYSDYYQNFSFPYMYETYSSMTETESIVGYIEFKKDNTFKYEDMAFPKQYKTYTNDIIYLPNKNRYLSSFGYNIYYIPSIDKEDGSINPLYKQAKEGKINPLAVFNGREESNRILELRGNKNYSSWKPQNLSEDENVLKDYPCVSCCDMFYTVGTSQKQWYCPSVGELYTMFAYLLDIKNSIQKVIDNGFNAIGFDDYRAYHSSTESHNEQHFCLAPYGSISLASKNLRIFSYRCKAFLSI